MLQLTMCNMCFIVSLMSSIGWSETARIRNLNLEFGKTQASTRNIPMVDNFAHLLEMIKEPNKYPTTFFPEQNEDKTPLNPTIDYSHMVPVKEDPIVKVKAYTLCSISNFCGPAIIDDILKKHSSTLSPAGEEHIITRTTTVESTSSSSSVNTVDLTKAGNQLFPPHMEAQSLSFASTTVATTIDVVNTDNKGSLQSTTPVSSNNEQEGGGGTISHGINENQISNGGTKTECPPETTSQEPRPAETAETTVKAFTAGESIVGVKHVEPGNPSESSSDQIS